MPKIKSHKGTTKRMKRTGGGKFLRHQAKYLGGKSSRQRCQMRRTNLVKANQKKAVDALLR